MAIRYPIQDYPYLADPEDLIHGGQPPAEAPGGFRIDSLAVASVILLLFLAFQLVRDRSRSAGQVSSPESVTTSDSMEGEKTPAIPNSGLEEAPPPLLPAVPNPNLIAYPYDDYWLTQGPHGFSYGHMAIDLAAGNGVAIKSPVYGTVTANYIDQYGNTTIVIENERYQVTLLHGNYTVAVGQAVTLGDIIGSESNNGYTTDMYGNSCRGRDCGYHTHLNVFDLSLGQNVNPLEILGA